jgi:branched-chain amino acid transport system ATP-binding protein
MEKSEHHDFLKVSNLGIEFGSLQALKDVSFEVSKGEIFGIAGPNGAGKTTLLNIISGALKPSKGEVYIDGEPIVGLKPMEVCYKGIARTFQIPAFFPTLSIYDNIRVGIVFGRKNKKEKGFSISEIIDFVGLKGKENQIASNIDLYSRKILMLAVAIATNPKIILLDEPLGGLNFQEIDIYLNLIKSLNKDHRITFLIVEHLFDKLVEISQNILILNFGQQIYIGPSNKVSEDKRVIEVYLGIK